MLGAEPCCLGSAACYLNVTAVTQPASRINSSPSWLLAGARSPSSPPSSCLLLRPLHPIPPTKHAAVGLLPCPGWGALLQWGPWDPGVRQLVCSSWTEVPVRVVSVLV